MASVANVRLIGAFISEPGVKPVEADYDPTTKPIQWGVVAGSSMWQATLESDLAQQARRIENYSLQEAATRQVEIWEIDPTLSPADIRVKPLFWGEIVACQIVIKDGEEREHLIARMEPYHFGNPIKGQTVDIGGTDTVVNIPLEFNPMVDAKIVFNRFKPTGDTNDWYHWIDPESTRTAAALAYQDGGGVAVNEEWDVHTICETLCELANGSEDFVRNVAHGNYSAQIYDTPEVRNAVYKTGQYLPFYLDAITQRYGCNWTIDQIVDATLTPEMMPKIRFFKQQFGTSRTVEIQAVGTVSDLTLSNVSALQMASDVGNLSNTVIGNGALIEREMTVPLVRSWPEADDGNEDHEDPHNHIGRKWVANEGGDYIDLRADITEPLSLGAGWQVKRRVIEDCLTYRDGTRRPVFLEYRTTPTGTWSEVPSEWGFRVLHNEIGIYFTGQRESGTDSGGIPEDALLTTSELRLTGTVRGDTRPTRTASASLASPNTNEIITVIDLSDRFFDRARATGANASVLTGSADTQDDSTLLNTYVDETVLTAALADIEASITLFGLHFDDEYKIGDLITAVDGRAISLNRATASGSAKYVQIVGITYHNQTGHQSTTLNLSAFGVAS